MKRIINRGQPPGGYPVPDNQGKELQCTSFAVAKAIVHAFHQGRVVADESIDISQKVVTGILYNAWPNLDPRWPDDFHEMRKTFQDSENRYWKPVIKVEKIDVDLMTLDDYDDTRRNSYVLVYNDPYVSKHCVFVHSIDWTTETFHCINSNGDLNRFPKVPIYQGGNVIFRVTPVLDKDDAPTAPFPTASVFDSSTPRSYSDNENKPSAPSHTRRREMLRPRCHQGQAILIINHSVEDMSRRDRRQEQEQDYWETRREVDRTCREQEEDYERTLREMERLELEGIGYQRHGPRMTDREANNTRFNYLDHSDFDEREDFLEPWNRITEDDERHDENLIDCWYRMTNT